MTGLLSQSQRYALYLSTRYLDTEVLQFNPVDLALQLLDSDSAGKDIDSFKQTKTRLARALKGSVDS